VGRCTSLGLGENAREDDLVLLFKIDIREWTT
jgi:hypothetical protein